MPLLSAWLIPNASWFKVDYLATMRIILFITCYVFSYLFYHFVMFFYHFKLELAQLLRFNYPSTIIQKTLSEKFVAILWFVPFFFLLTFQILVVFIETHLLLALVYWGFYWYHFFQFSAGIFPLRLNDFESTNFLEIYLSIFVLTRLPISEPVKAFQIFQKSDETQWNYVWHPGANHVRT